jgi:hypothetical protein
MKSSQKTENRKKKKIWQAHLDAQVKSGLNQAEYCRQNKLIASRFTYWKIKFKNSENKLLFIPVSSSQTEAISCNNNSSIELLLDAKYRIKINDDFNPSILSKLIATLRHV